MISGRQVYTGERPLGDMVAVVTGSSRGIGKATAIAMAEAGAHVVITYVSSREMAEEVAQQIETTGVQSLVVGVDISQREQVEDLFAQIMETFGRVDVLVNNAVTFQRPMPLVEMPEDVWDRVMAVNLKGSFLCAQAAARQMIQQGGGAIVNISTLGAEVTMANMGAYISSKGGVSTLTRALALELAPHGIRVNGIAPGHISTDMNVQWLAEAPGREERFHDRIALGRLGKTEEVASVAVFLASEAAGYMTGQILYVEGGVMMWQGPIL